MASKLTHSARLALLGCAFALSAGCGGGSASSPPPPAPTPTPAPAPAPPPAAPPSADDAARFLMQASFGPTEADIARVQSLGYAGWIDDQLALPQSPHLPYVKANYNAQLFGANFAFVQDSFWQQAIPAPDQLRQRVKYALSQIVVVSAESGTLANVSDGLANYYDLLGLHAFGNYRALLEAVATSPVMGIYLSHLRNQKADPLTGRVPDENFAREVMQLFSIGLTEINLDGTPKLVNGQPVETYTNADITGLARVFTGWSWAAQDTSNASFNGGGTAYTDRILRPMQPYPQFHETGTKSFLNVTIPANTPAQASLTLALDTLFNHPNLCPFIGRQLIQRLVTSNPSPAYVGRVSAACANNGAGVRGDLKEPAVRQAARAGAAAGAVGALLRRDLGLRQLADPQSRQPGDVAWPAAAARAVGVQLLPARLRAGQHGNRCGQSGCTGIPDHRRNLGGRLHQLHAGHHLERSRRRPRSARRLHERARRGRQRRRAARPRQSLPDGRHDGHAAAAGNPRRGQRDRRHRHQRPR